MYVFLSIAISNYIYFINIIIIIIFNIIIHCELFTKTLASDLSLKYE